MPGVTLARGMVKKKPAIGANEAGKPNLISQDCCADDFQHRAGDGKINPIEGLITMGESGIQVDVMSKRPQATLFLFK